MGEMTIEVYFLTPIRFYQAYKTKEWKANRFHSKNLDFINLSDRLFDSGTTTHFCQ